ncbi:MAG: hypothetical protein QM270_08300 [Bacillota bacterium]|nr:hypothetical protein [Bacillota bacterium]
MAGSVLRTPDVVAENNAVCAAAAPLPASARVHVIFVGTGEAFFRTFLKDLKHRGVFSAACMRAIGRSLLHFACVAIALTNCRNANGIRNRIASDEADRHDLLLLGRL